jgi:hypothetical protein
MTKKNFLFIGECRSATAQARNWTWRDGRLAAKPLFEALEAMGLDPANQEFVNLWHDRPHRVSAGWKPMLNEGVISGLHVTTWIKVALGKRVSAMLTKLSIDHIAIVHPAARGRIRLRRRYIKHVSDKLGHEVWRTNVERKKGNPK